MLRLLFILVACWLPLSQSPSAAETAVDVDRAVATFNPDLYALDAGKVVHRMGDAFTAPASDIARDVQQGTWFSTLVFLPFLVLPLALLLYIIFKFRARPDQPRSPATFMGNHTLEIVWTAIPCVALVIVGIPMWGLLYKMELPPGDQSKDMVVEVRGKSFAWDYKYLKLGGDRPTRREDQFELGADAAGVQEPLVLVQGRRVILNMTSNDVNHAWWIPAFGIKKDCIKGRYTNAWFTPDTLGFFKGQCAELCGQGHGIMLCSAVVVDEADFALWTDLQRHRADAARVWNALTAAVPDPGATQAAVSAYLAKDASPGRRFALRYWIAANGASVSRTDRAKAALVPAWRSQLEQFLVTVAQRQPTTLVLGASA
jgi:cytochrome c oxidase subunit 2